MLVLLLNISTNLNNFFVKSMIDDIIPPPIQTLQKYKNLVVDVLRLDLIHPTITGNKWYKLKFNLLAAQKNNIDTILTFGGAYSNHIFATAAAGQIFACKTIGIIRGEETLPLNPCLTFATNAGMKLVYVDRTSYRNKHTVEFLDALHEKFGEFYVIPEGGANELAVEGVAELAQTLPQDYDAVVCACGTGTTLAGLRKGFGLNTKIIGIPVLKNGEFLYSEINQLLTNELLQKNYTLLTNYAWGGYAKTPEALLQFIADFTIKNSIPLEPIYTGKLFFAVHDLIQQNYFKNQQKILMVHSGGHQLVVNN
jgi:1-aminocyclopropane-1-carboxylate deaminase